MTRTAVALVAVILMGPAGRPLAHHAVGGEYDPNKPVVLTGAVTKVEWVNPHARLYFDVTNADGTVTNWSVELAARVVLERMGWNGRSLRPGDKITVRGDQARSGAPMLNARAQEQRTLRESGGTPQQYPIVRDDGTPVLHER